MRTKEPLSDRFYRALLYLLPSDFRGEYGDDMEETFRGQRAEQSRRSGLLRLWWDTAIDIVKTAPSEHLTQLRQDSRYALRLMRKNIGQTTLAVAILGLGIGANTAIFSVVHSVLLKPLPYTSGEELVAIRQYGAKAGVEDLRFSVQEITDYRERNRSLAEVAEYHNMTFTLFGRGDALRVRTGVVSHQFFPMLGVRPIQGRTFVADDDQSGAPAVLVLSYDFWKDKLHGDPAIVGQTFRMNNRPHTVVGVLPRIPQYPNENDVYMPVSACPFRSSRNFVENRNARMMRVFGRLRDRQSVEHCRRDLAGIATSLESEHPQSYTKGLGYGVSATLLRDELTKNARTILLVLLGAATFVLLIACANVANLTLARMSQRERELVIRTALGAGHGRLMRQLLTESFLLSLFGAAAGVAFAYGSVELLVKYAARLTPRAYETATDGYALGFALLCAVATSMISGSVAALASRREIARGLKEASAQSTAGARPSRVRGLLIASQVAFSYMLLVGAGLTVRSLINLEHVNTGFTNQSVIAMDIYVNWSKYTRAADLRDVSERLLQKLETQPGVMSAAIASSFPFNPDDGGRATRFVVEGEALRDGEIPRGATLRTVSTGYFQTLGIPILKGREFTAHDGPDALQVAIISDTLARRRFGGRDPIGRRITQNGGQNWITVVGVAGDVKDFGVDKDAHEQIYAPALQSPAPGAVLVRTAGDPAAMITTLQRAIHEVDPETAIARVNTLAEARDETLEPPRNMARLLSLFAAVALIIAATGIGGMLAVSVTQRVREIGIRVALGETPGHVIGSTLQQGMGLVVAGLLAGSLGALALTKVFRSLVFHVPALDPVTYSVVGLLLVGCAGIACLIPASRAARVDVMRALRCD